jgi:hypothetical protein
LGNAEQLLAVVRGWQTGDNDPFVAYRKERRFAGRAVTFQVVSDVTDRHFSRNRPQRATASSARERGIVGNGSLHLPSPPSPPLKRLHQSAPGPYITDRSKPRVINPASSTEMRCQ